MSQANYRNEEAIRQAKQAARPVEIQETPLPQDISLNWNVLFKQTFAVDQTLDKEQFIALAKEHIEWLKADFLRQLEGYPQELFKVLDRYGVLNRDAFK